MIYIILFYFIQEYICAKYPPGISSCPVRSSLRKGLRSSSVTTTSRPQKMMQIAKLLDEAVAARRK
jgi:hypothetical protein